MRPFDHRRTLIAGFVAAEMLLQHLLKQLFSDSRLRPSPVVVIHPLEHLDGGFTQVEVCAFRELRAALGGRVVFFWVGRALSADELRRGAFGE